MCVILIGKVSASMHKTALAQNGDGFSVYTNETGLVKDPSKEVVESCLNKFAVWHYRIGTSGRKDEYNIHPFPVCGGRYYLYHNGVLGSGVGDMSDTHALAALLYKANMKTVRTVLESLSEGQRFLLVSAKDCRVYETYGKWSFDAGVLMSHRLMSYTYGKPFRFDDNKDNSKSLTSTQKKALSILDSRL